MALFFSNLISTKEDKQVIGILKTILIDTGFECDFKNWNSFFTIVRHLLKMLKFIKNMGDKNLYAPKP